MKFLISAVSGALFAVGLALGGMLQPSRVVGFLDFFGAWDPTLAFVMLGAVSVNALAFRLTRRRSAPLLDAEFHLPLQTGVSPRLVAGSVVFGVGWALSGYCPGPAVASLASGAPTAAGFVVAMTAATIVTTLLLRRREERAATHLTAPAVRET